MIKHPNGIVWSLHEFFHRMEPIFDYYGHLSIWADVFGSSAVQVHTYERVRTNLIESFLEHALGIKELSGLTHPQLMTNASLHPDVMEVKRILNGRPMNDAVRFMMYRAAVEVSQKKYRNNHLRLLSLADRREILEKGQASNDRLRREFSVELNSDLSETQGIKRGVVYPGLTAEDAVSLAVEIDKVLTRPGFRLEKLARRIAYVNRKHFSFLGYAFSPLQRIYYQQLSIVKSERQR